ncbi:prolipoprotein diacylglyceryl transferase family protein [Clostridium sp. Cult1]|uniref:prolipoprotein diacylglyceryl transferase family protein n=1 Tax=Clostridium sp. Cult1 TaxID=2079002 RepID=UPI001F2D60A1|nr:prolipoprotein diacylglyceryl transferase family protein [Clostridium sp. Cult1]MCF6461977.1 prolipoprotein diacylglyceryl transferase Lgt [Clostridium sp. Cult1]
MKPFFFTFKSINITWFMAIGIVIATISYIITGFLAKEYKEDKNKIEDIFMVLLIVGFIGARISYVLMNLQSYKGNISSIFKISHYNLSLLGGLIFGVLTLILLSKIYKIEFYNLFRIYIIPFYFSMAVGIWILMFDLLLLASTHLNNDPIKILYVSLLFLMGLGLELVTSNKYNNKYISFIILVIVMFLYYMI